MVHAIFTSDGGENSCTGYTIVSYSSDLENETVVETTENDLASIFETAKANGGTLDGTDETIDAAIDDPLSFIDYLILDADGVISFDDSHVREDPTTSTS